MIGRLAFAPRQRVLRALRNAARRSGTSTARAELRVAWLALVTMSATGGRHGGKRPRPLNVSSETIANHVRSEIGPRWGISRATADAALGELRDDGLVTWPTPAPVIEVQDVGTCACVGREVREIWLTAAAERIASDALGMQNPEISGVTCLSGAAAPDSEGAQAVPRRDPTVQRPPGASIAALLAFASRNVAPF